MNKLSILLSALLLTLYASANADLPGFQRPQFGIGYHLPAHQIGLSLAPNEILELEGRVRFDGMFMPELENMLIGGQLRFLIRRPLAARSIARFGLGGLVEGDLDAMIVGGLIPFGIQAYPFDVVPGLGLSFEIDAFVRTILGEALNIGLGGSLGFVYFF